MNSHYEPADDPRLTAYALGELDPAEHAEVEELLSQSKAAREAVDEILAVSGLLVDELRQQPIAELSDSQRDAIYQQADEVVASNNGKPPRLTVTKVPTVEPVRSRSWVAVIATCASLVAVLVLGALIANNELPLAGNQREFNSGTEITFDFGTNHQQATSGSLDPVTNDRSVIVTQTRENGESFFGDKSKSVIYGGRPKSPIRAPNVYSLKQLESSGKSKNFESKPSIVRQQIRISPGDLKTTPAQRSAGGLAGNGQAGSGGATPKKNELYYYSQTEASAGSTVLGVTPRIIVQTEEGRQLGQVVAGKSVSQNGLQKIVPVERYGRRPLLEAEVSLSQKPYTRGHHFTLTEDLVATPSSRFGAYTDEYKTKLSQTRGGRNLTLATDDSGSMAIRPDFSDALTFEYTVDSNKKVQAVIAEGRFYRVVPETKTLVVITKDKPEELQQAREAYAKIIDNPFVSSNDEPLSTFSIDVDTASYTNVRRFLNNNQLPPADAVRIEEMINYFKYDHEFAAAQYYNEGIKTEPFEVAMEVGPAPWKTNHQLVRVAVQGHAIPTESRPASQLVFLIDVSGSMKDANKLPLVKQGLRMLVDQMDEDDRIGIVTYSNNATVLLEPINGGEKSQLWAAIDSLEAQGSTNGAAGLQMAYDLARQFEDEKTTRRVIVCTDGDFNVGISDDNELVAFIKKQATEDHIFLSVFGFGTGNIKDSKLEQIADHGNGHYAYVDGFGEAKRVFVEELTGTLFTLAKDVKIQVEINPAAVAEYRLIGYENRALAAADFNNDKKDGGELGAGQTVVALYEVVPVGVKRSQQPGVDELKYGKPKPKDNSAEAQQGEPKLSPSTEMLTLKIRYKAPDGKTSKKLERVLNDPQFSNLYGRPATGRKKFTDDFHWSATVAAFGMLLRHSEYCNDASYDQVLEWASEAVGDDPQGRRKEMIGLMEKARKLQSK